MTTVAEEGPGEAGAGLCSNCVVKAASGLWRGSHHPGAVGVGGDIGIAAALPALARRGGDNQIRR